MGLDRSAGGRRAQSRDGQFHAFHAGGRRHRQRRRARRLEAPGTRHRLVARARRMVRRSRRRALPHQGGARPRALAQRGGDRADRGFEPLDLAAARSGAGGVPRRDRPSSPCPPSRARPRRGSSKRITRRPVGVIITPRSIITPKIIAVIRTTPPPDGGVAGLLVAGLSSFRRQTLRDDGSPSGEGRRLTATRRRISGP